jgi:hypothetical protein
MITQLRCTILETSLYAFPVLLLAKIDLNPNYLYSLLLVTISCVRLAVSNWDALYLFQAFSTAMLTRILFVFSSHASCLPEESNLNDCRLLTSVYFVLLSLKDLSIGLIALYTQPMASLYLLHLPPPVYLHTLSPSWWGLTRTITLPPLYVVCVLSYPF